jgi:cyanophycinase-like exopeptidase
VTTPRTSSRILAIMGSGETAPTMKGPHRSIFERLAPDARAVLLDTPFGFQENAPILAAKAVEYFRDAVGRDVDVAGLGRTDTGDVVAVERALARIRDADWLFAGPGSPTFALAQWRGTPVPDALTEKLRSGGAVVFSSAAALTLGVATVPVYEIYKVGVDPYWLEGLDVLGEIGLNVAVIPHFDNQEGGNHDTRFCYLGERRLALLEPDLPGGAFVLGIDEHTGMIVDLDADTAEIVGKGAVTLRHQGLSLRLESGTVHPLDTLRAGPGSGHVTGAAAQGSVLGPTHLTGADAPGSDLGLTRDPGPSGTTRGATAPETLPDSLAAVTKLEEAEFDQALTARDADGAVAAILQLESAIVEWSRDTLQSDEVDRARAALRSMIVRLGASATEGLRDVRDVVGPVVEAALAARVVARSEKSFAVSDAIRDELVKAGIEVRDTPDGVEWLVAPR